ncbi:hypothetical protein [Rugamonas rubra]|uniref:hypothetical protein n=1 Tax=Rugamonas rubra TaxID=758825 RepID=UPI000B81EFF6|nr:hypothetical protein [Rugamonas rubra]
MTAQDNITASEDAAAAEADAVFGESSFTPNDIVGNDALASKEAIAISNGSLQADADKQEHNRHQTFRNHINRATLIVFWSVMACLIVSIFIFTFHMITPESWHFLNDDQIGTLKTLLGGAILSSAMSGYVTNRMKG